MNHPCSASIDELKHDKPESKLDIYSREELIDSTTKDLLDVYEEDPHIFIDSLNEPCIKDMLYGLIFTLMNPEDHDHLDAYYKCVETIQRKQRDSAEVEANEKAREAGL